jgi:hypothetical protein
METPVNQIYLDAMTGIRTPKLTGTIGNTFGGWPVRFSEYAITNFKWKTSKVWKRCGMRPSKIKIRYHEKIMPTIIRFGDILYIHPDLKKHLDKPKPENQ